MTDDMDKITLRKMIEKDFHLIKQWLESDSFKYGYKKWYKTIDQLRDKINNIKGKNDYIKYFIIINNSIKVGFCQYYDCFTAQKYCDDIDKENIRYCIDYVIIERMPIVYDQYEVIKKLIKKIKNKNGKEIIVEYLGTKSLIPFISNGFQVDKKNLYKLL